MEQIVLTFKDNAYSLTKVLARGKTGPIAKVDLNEINLTDAARALISLSEPCPQLDLDTVILYKHEGKFIAFSGHAQITKAIEQNKTWISAHILSGPALKTARHVVFTEQELADIKARDEERAYPRTPRREYGDRNYGERSYDRSDSPRRYSDSPLRDRKFSSTRSGS